MRLAAALKKNQAKKIIQEASKKAKSIRVSPLESRLNTGCLNSPKNSLSPKRTSKNLPSYISRYVSKALANPNLFAKKRNINSAAYKKRTVFEEPTNERPFSKRKNSCEHRPASILFEGKNSSLNKDQQLTKPSENACSNETSRNFLFLSSDSEELVREKVIENIKSSFKDLGVGPVTTTSFYKIGQQIGNGAFGKVHMAVNRLTGLKVAIKTIEKAFIKDQRTRRKIFQEVFIMKKLCHCNIIRILEVFESSNKVMIALEYAGGGDLLQIIKYRGRLTEEEAKGIFFQVIGAVKACHLAGIVHRDVKLDNILLNSDMTEIKLCDFGVSRFAKAGEIVKEQCGTPAYLAPEIIADQGYEPFYVDLWSMGVLLYAMLSATVPFKAKNLPDLHKLVLRGKYEIPQYFSSEATDLIGKMLNPVPQLRISLDDMKKHSWFNGFVEEKVTDGGYNLKRQNAILSKMMSYGFPRDYVMQSLNLKDVNHATATYNLLEISESV